MPEYFALTPEGFVDGLLTMDEQAAAVHPLKPGYRLVPTTSEVGDVVRMLGKAALVRDGQVCVMPEAAAVRWDAARGLMLGHVKEDRDRRRACRREAWWQQAAARAGVRELPDDDPAWVGPGARELPRPRCHVPFQDVELVPDLWIRQIVGEAAMADFHARVLATQLFDEGDEDTDTRIARWLYGPHALPLMVTWHDEVLQYECYHVDENEIAPGTARAGFNTHVDDERPYWFWAIVAQPALQALRAAGYRRLQANVIAEKPDYLGALQHYYGGVELGRTRDGRWARVEYDLDEALSRAPAWPTRPTAGPGWAHQVGDVTIREAVEADEPALEAVLRARWPAPRRQDEILRMFRKWWHLDRAAVLLGIVDGQVRHMRGVRFRRPGLASVSGMLPVTEAGQAEIAAAVGLWCRQVGFDRISQFIPAAQWEHPAVRAVVDRALSRAQAHTITRRQRHGGEVVEIVMTL